jgi:hypothetical protein
VDEKSKDRLAAVIIVLDDDPQHPPTRRISSDLLPDRDDVEP